LNPGIFWKSRPASVCHSIFWDSSHRWQGMVGEESDIRLQIQTVCSKWNQSGLILIHLCISSNSQHCTCSLLLRLLFLLVVDSLADLLQGGGGEGEESTISSLEKLTGLQVSVHCKVSAVRMLHQ